MRLAGIVAAGVLIAGCGSSDQEMPTARPEAAASEVEIDDGADSTGAEPIETPDEELDRLVLKHDREPVFLFAGRDDPARVQKYFKEIVVKARQRAEADIAAGEPQIVLYGLTMANTPDIDPSTGFFYRYLG